MYGETRRVVCVIDSRRNVGIVEDYRQGGEPRQEDVQVIYGNLQVPADAVWPSVCWRYIPAWDQYYLQRGEMELMPGVSP